MSESKHTRAGRVRCAGCGIPISNPAESCPECAETKAGWTEMLEALRGLMWPNVASADDLMVLVLAAGVTSAQQEKIRPFVEALRKAQEAGRAAIRKATGGEQ